MNKMTEPESRKHLCLGKWAQNVPEAKARADGRAPKFEVDQDKQAMNCIQECFSDERKSQRGPREKTCPTKAPVLK